MRIFSPAHERRPQGLRTHIDTFPMMAFSGSSAKNFAQHGPFRSSSAKNFAQHGPFRSSSAKNFAQHAIKRRFWAILSTLGELFRAHTHTRPRRENFFALTPIPGRAGRTFSHIARDEGNFETTNTFARHTARPLETSNTFAGHAARPIETINTFAGHAARPIETDNTFAGSKWPKNGLSSLAKAMTVSFRCKEVLAKVLPVS